MKIGWGTDHTGVTLKKELIPYMEEKGYECVDYGSYDENDRADRIYINFCNPWPKKKHKKRRLTHTRQLLNYKKFLKGELWFKTDDDELFEESFEYFAEAGYRIKYKTFDLHAESPYENFVTEHENMFTEEGKKIKFLIAEPVTED